MRGKSRQGVLLPIEDGGEELPSLRCEVGGGAGHRIESEGGALPNEYRPWNRTMSDPAISCENVYTGSSVVAVHVPLVSPAQRIRKHDQHTDQPNEQQSRQGEKQEVGGSLGDK